MRSPVLLVREKILQNKSFATLIEKILAFVFITMLVTLVLSQANPLTNYPSRDGGAFAYGGHIILEGKLLYVDIWDNKPPGIFFINAFALWLGKDTLWGIWLVEFLFLLGAAWVGYLFMKDRWNPGVAIISTVIWLLGLNKPLTGGNFTEEYSLLFNFLAIYAFGKSIQEPGKVIYDLAIGISLALSFLFRANNIGIQVSIILVWAIISISGRKFLLLFRKIGMLCIGFVAILILVCVYFLVHGTLYAMFEASILYNFFYISKVGLNFWQLDIVRGFSQLGLAAWTALSGYIIVLQKMIKGVMAKSLDEVSLLLLVGWPVEIMLTGLTGKGYGHYFISWLTIVAILCGFAISFVFSKISKFGVVKVFNQRMSSILLIFILALLMASWKSWGVYAHSFYTVLFNRGGGVEAVNPIAQYVQEITDPSDTVLVWGGEAGLNLMAKRDSPTAYFYYPLFANSPILPRLEAGFLTDIMSRPPKVIVDAYIDAPYDVYSLDAKVRSIQHQTVGMASDWGVIKNMDQVFGYISRHYHLVYQMNNYDIYVLNGQ